MNEGLLVVLGYVAGVAVGVAAAVAHRRNLAKSAALERRREELAAALRRLEAQRSLAHPDHRAALEERINAVQDELFVLDWGTNL